MLFALRDRRDPTPRPGPVPDLVVERAHDPAEMAALEGTPCSAMVRRFEAGHRAYVARCSGGRAAWGWVATRSAEIEEMGTVFALPPRERYVWDLVTLVAHREADIRSCLLDVIVGAESREADRFWVAYPSEHHAWGASIRQAGFVALAELALDATGRAAVRGLLPGGERIAARVLALPETQDHLVPCWHCVRARRGHASCGAGRCRCDHRRPVSGCAA